MGASQRARLPHDLPVVHAVVHALPQLIQIGTSGLSNVQQKACSSKTRSINHGACCSTPAFADRVSASAAQAAQVHQLTTAQPWSLQSSFDEAATGAVVLVLKEAPGAVQVPGPAGAGITNVCAVSMLCRLTSRVKVFTVLRPWHL